MESRRNALEVSTHAVARLALRREFRVLRTSQSSRAAEVCVIARENPCLDKDCSTPSRLRRSQKKRPRVILLSVFSSHVDDLSIKELSQDFLYRQITPFALVLQPLTAQKKRVVCRICDEGSKVNTKLQGRRMFSSTLKKRPAQTQMFPACTRWETRDCVNICVSNVVAWRSGSAGPLQGQGRRFKSCRDHHLFIYNRRLGHHPAASTAASCAPSSPCG